VALGSFLLSNVTSTTSLSAICGFTVIFGAGLGLTMQVLILAVQNTVDRRDLGIATSTSMFFRSMGGAIGVAMFGAIIASRLTTEIPRMLAERGIKVPSTDGLKSLLGTPDEIASLPEPLRGIIRDGFTLGLDRIYLVLVPMVLIGFVAMLIVREVPLRRHR
jgi:hypothetical protein